MRGALLFVGVTALCLGQGYQIESIAGNGVAGFSGDLGIAVRAQLHEPVAIALDSSGRVYVADSRNNRVRRADPDGTVRTVAGNGEPGNTGDGGSATDASLSVSDVAVDRDGTLYIAGGEFVRAVDPAGAIRTVVGPEAGLTSVTAIALESPASLLIVDGNRLRRIAPDRTVTDIDTGTTALLLDVAVAPDGTVAFLTTERIYTLPRSGSVVPLGVEVPVASTTRIAFDRLNELFVSGSRIWKIAGGRAWTVAGSDAQSYSGDGGPGLLATLNAPAGMAVDPGGNVYIADSLNHRIRLLRAPFSGSISAVNPNARATEIWPRNVALRWTPLPNATSYDVYFGTSPAALNRVAATSETSWPAGSLQDRTTYYWRIETRSLPNPPVISPTFSFTTTAVIGEVPPQPELVTPGNFTMGLPTTFTLTWRGGGATQYDVYLDDTEAVSKRIAITTEPRFVVTGLEANKQYYWRVVAINTLGESSSRRFEFTTGPENGFPWLIETIAGTTLPTADAALASESVILFPKALATHSTGTFFVDGRQRVRKIDPEGRVSTLFTPATGEVQSLAVDSQGNVFVALPEYVVRIPRTGQRTVFAGQPGRRDFAGDTGLATNAAFNGITDIAVDRRGVLYIADTLNHRLRSVTSAGQIRTVAGNGTCGEPAELTGPAATLPLCFPTAVASDSENNVYFGAHGRILRLRTDGTVELAADSVWPGSIAIDQANTVYYTDIATLTVRRVNPDGTTEAWAGEPDADGRAFGFFGDGLPASRARFAFPDSMAFDPLGNLLIADTHNHRIRAIDNNGVVNTIAGIDPARGGFLLNPTDVAVDGAGTVYIADSGNHRIQRVSPGRYQDTLAGGGQANIRDVRAAADRRGRLARDLKFDMTLGSVVEVDNRGTILFTDNRFSWAEPGVTDAIYAVTSSGSVQDVYDPRARVGGIARGASGELYVSDTAGHRILRIDESGTITVVAGIGTPGFSGDGGPVASAQIHTPRALSVSPDGELYVAEFGRVRRITADGRIVTVINEHANGLAHDRFGTLYLTAGRSVFVLTGDGRLVRVAGRENAPGLNDGGLALDARTSNPQGLAVTNSGEIVFADPGENLVRRLTPNIPSSLTIVEGTQLPFQVRVTGRSGRPVAGVPVRFELTSNTLTPILLSRPTTNADGVARLTGVGSRSGPMTIRAIVAGVPPVEFRITVAPPAQ